VAHPEEKPRTPHSGALPFRDLVPEVEDALDLQEVLTEIVSEATALVGADAGDIILKDDEAGVLRVVAVAGLPVSMLGVEYGLHEGLAARVLTANRTLSVRNYRQYRHRLQQLDPYNVRAVLTSPLVARGAPIGVLTVESTDPNVVFRRDDARLLTAFAKHAAVAIDNARRFERETDLVAQLERANVELSRSLTLQRRLVDRVLSDAGPEAVVEELATLLERPVVLQDHRLRVIAGACPPGGGDWEPLALDGSGADTSPLGRFLQNLAAFGRPEVVPDELVGQPRRLCAPITSGTFNVHGYLVTPEQPSSLLDRALLEVGTTGVALELVKQRARADAEQLVRGDLVNDLITGSYSDEELVAARASRLGYDLSRSHALVYLRIDDHRRALASLDEGELARVPRRMLEIVRAEIRAAAPDSVVGGTVGGVIVLVSHEPTHLGGYGDRPAKALAELLCARLQDAFPRLSFSAAVGERCERPADYAQSFELARDALDVMMKLGRIGIVIDTAELGLYRLLVAATPNEELDTYVERTLRPLLDEGARGQELIDTLRTYIESGFNRRETARRSYLHINTVANRLRRIEQLLGVDLGDADALLELAIALRLARLKSLV